MASTLTKPCSGQGKYANCLPVEGGWKHQKETPTVIALDKCTQLNRTWRCWMKNNLNLWELINSSNCDKIPTAFYLPWPFDGLGMSISGWTVPRVMLNMTHIEIICQCPITWISLIFLVTLFCPTTLFTRTGRNCLMSGTGSGIIGGHCKLETNAILKQ